MKPKTLKIFVIFLALVIFALAFPKSVTADNASLNYVWNSSCETNDNNCWIPWIATDTGKPQVDLNLLNITSKNISSSDSILSDFIFPEASSFISLLGGNVGIGLATPTHTLTVEGDLNVTGQTYFTDLNISRFSSWVLVDS